MKRDMSSFVIVMSVVTIMAYLALYIPTPYVVFKPGTAEDVGPMVSVAEPDVREDSRLMLTTVLQSFPNWASYVAATFNRHWDVYRKSDIFAQGETQQQYTERQQVIMLSSQSNAMQAAYQQSDVPYRIQVEGVVVVQTIPGMPAASVLQAGDYLLQMDGSPVEAGEQIVQHVSGLAVGDQVSFEFRRGDEVKVADVRVGDFSKLPEEWGGGADKETPGLGIRTANVVAIKAEDPARQITVDVHDIGGPSAGLMFALEMVDQLTPGDLTRGYHIAGTGTIGPDGTVGSIGGVKHKVAAAYDAGAQLFFVPPGNEQEAVDRARSLKTDMRIVAVDTLASALDYLAAMPPAEK